MKFFFTRYSIAVVLFLLLFSLKAQAQPANGKLFIVGSAVGGSFTNPIPTVDSALQQFTQISATEYKITIGLTGGGEYKFIDSNGYWGNNWGIAISDNPAEIYGGSFVAVVNNVGPALNILAPPVTGYYTIDVNFKTDSFSVKLINPITPSITPTTGYYGTSVTIKGIEFTGATAVTFGDTAASFFTVLNDSTIIAIVGTGGSGGVAVTTLKGSVISIAGFTYTPPATPTSLFIVGTAVAGGWSNPIPPADSAVQQFTQVSATEFKITIPLIGGQEYKFISVDGSWTTNWGIAWADDPYEIYSGNIDFNTYNILAPPVSGSYVIDVNFYTGKFTVQTPPKPVAITSFSPTTGTYGTPITIHGHGFNTLNSNSVNGEGDKYLNTIVLFGSNNFNYHEDSITILSDSVLIAWVGNGVSGNIYLVSNYTTLDSLPGFIYNPLPPITNPGWEYVGGAGFSSGTTSYFVTTAIGTDNTPYISYIDAKSYQLVVMKYEGDSWKNVGAVGSAGLVPQYFSSVFLVDNNNAPIVAYADSSNSRTSTFKKFDGNNWVTLTTTNSFQIGSLAIDKNNNLYNFDGANVYEFNNGSWSSVGNTNIVLNNTSSFPGQFNITIDKVNNTPYIVYSPTDSITYAPQASVMKFDGSNWVTVGQSMFESSNATFGSYYNDIAIDGTGTPWFSSQTDNSFERASVYKYTSGEWNTVGYPRFSKAHIQFPSFALNKNNTPYLLYQDVTYNGQGTVMSYTDTGSWRPVGVRGFLPGNSFQRNSLIIDANNTPIIAFSDNTQGGKVSVMKFGNNSLPVSIVRISAIPKESKIQLTWETTNEPNTSDFVVQHSTDGISFKSIGSVKAIGVGANDYQFIDTYPAYGINYYRLQSVDKDGAASFSKVASVQFALNSNQLSVYPNPAKSIVTISGNHIASVHVIDNIGRVVSVQTLHDAMKPTIAVGKLPAGVYHLRIQTTDGNVSVVSFVKE